MSFFDQIRAKRVIIKKDPIYIPYKKWYNITQNDINTDDETKATDNIADSDIKTSDNDAKTGNTVDEFDGNFVKITAVSDTHMGHNKLNVPNGDILVLSGDFTNNGTMEEAKKVNEWFGSLLDKKAFKHILLICGNHEGYSADKDPGTGVVTDSIEDNKNDYSASIKELKKVMNNCTILYESGITLYGIKFYGIPWCPHLPYEIETTNSDELIDYEFYLTRKSIENKWKLIPKDVNYLITHTPPFGILDANDYGCTDLLAYICNNLKQLKVHQFGHCHGGYGWCMVEKSEFIKNNSDNNANKRVIQYKKMDEISNKIKNNNINIFNDCTLFVNAANASNIDMNSKIPPDKDDAFEEPVYFELPIINNDNE